MVRAHLVQRLAPLCGALALCAACTQPVDFCGGMTAFAWDPLSGDAPGALPDDWYTVADASTPTGLRVRVDDETAPWLADLPAEHAPSYRWLSTLDGWGVNAAIALRFTGRLAAQPAHVAEPSAADAVQLLDLGDAQGVRRVPLRLSLTDEGTTLLPTPLVPLRPKTRHALVVTAAARDEAGSCLAPGRALRSLLDGTAPEALQRLSPRLDELLARSGLGKGELSAAALFTTQGVYDRGERIAREIAASTPDWAGPATCADQGVRRKCSRPFLAKEYRDPAPDGASDQLLLTAHVWLPKTAGAHPFLMWGHGIADTHGSAGRTVDLVTPMGMAVVATDAPCHGDHPGAYPDAVQQTFCFTGLLGGAPVLKPLVVRENIRGPVFERLQLLRLLDLHPDVDGDGAADLDTAKAGYAAMSLGGVMGIELIARHDRFGVVPMFVTGGPVGVIVRDSKGFSSLLIAVRAGATDGDVDRLLPVAQAILDSGDPVSYAPLLLARRAAGTGPHVLLGLARDDDTIPNSSTYDLARALGLARIGATRGPEPLIPDLAVPLSGNAPGGRTAGLFEYDRVTFGEGQTPRAAEHPDTDDSREGMLQRGRFIQDWLEGRTPVLVDPYAELGTPPL